MEPTEIVFIVFALAFALEELTAAKEHGWQSNGLLCALCIAPTEWTRSLSCQRESPAFTLLVISP